MVDRKISDFLYPLMILIGIVSALFLLEAFFKKCRLKKGTATDYEIAICISAAVGILFSVLVQNLYDFIDDPEHFSFSFGMTFFGGLFGGVLCFFLIYWIWLRRKYPDTLPYLLTVVGAAIPLAHGWGRIGCFIAGCCYGKEVDPSSPYSWLGVKFVTTDAKVLPTNLFEAIYLFAIAGVLIMFVFKIRDRRSLPLYCISYGIFRFLIEFLRGDYRGSFIPGITPSQFWSILLILFGLIYFAYLCKGKKAKLEIRND